MGTGIEELIDAFEEGAVTRRELIAAMSAMISFSASTSLEAQEPVQVYDFDPRSFQNVMLARLANMKFTIKEGQVVPDKDSLIFPDPVEETNPHREWLFGSSGLLSGDRKPIAERMGEKLGAHEGTKEDDKFKRGYVFKVSEGNNLLGRCDLVYEVMRAKIKLVEKHSHDHGYEHGAKDGKNEVLAAATKYVGDLSSDEKEWKKLIIDKLNSLAPPIVINALTAHTW